MAVSTAFTWLLLSQLSILTPVSDVQGRSRHQSYPKGLQFDKLFSHSPGELASCSAPTHFTSFNCICVTSCIYHQWSVQTWFRDGLDVGKIQKSSPLDRAWIPFCDSKIEIFWVLILALLVWISTQCDTHKCHSNAFLSRSRSSRKHVIFIQVSGDVHSYQRQPLGLAGLLNLINLAGGAATLSAEFPTARFDGCLLVSLTMVLFWPFIFFWTHPIAFIHFTEGT